MFRYLLLAFVSVVPFMRLRLAFYRLFFRFQIAPTAKIRMFTFLDTQELVMKDHAEIRGFGNVFMSMYRVELDTYARIGAPRIGMNFFRGTANKKHLEPAGIRVGKCSVIELFHYFDVCGEIVLGNNVVIGGIRSVFFTHALHKDSYEPIRIEDDVYVGSNCLFQMGVSVPRNCVVGMGSVVVKPIEKENSFIAGVPAQVVKENTDFDMRAAMRLRRRPYFEDGQVILPDKTF
jgi:acetyltransferase-like isoleucine patch superfamily enzyme